MVPITRRQFILGGGTAVASLALLGAAQASGVGAALRFLDDPGRPRIDRVDQDYQVYPHSVSSGDPTPTGCILWTRIAPAAYDAQEDVWFEVALAPDFKQVTARGRIPSGQVRAEAAHTVRVDIDGLLGSDRWYHYRFIHAGVASKPGRLRTAPATDADVEKLRFAVFSCSNFPDGHFNGYGMAVQDQVDYVLHLGDFIYEYNAPEPSIAGRPIVLPSGKSRMVSREDLDYVYATYRSDKNLRLLLEQHTMMHIADDHEIANNRYYDYAEERYHGDGGFPIDEDAAATGAYFLAAMKAYYDWIPSRFVINARADHPFEYAEPYRRLRFGKLIDLFLIDGRWFRSKQGALPGSENSDVTETTQNDGTMLGKKQMGWFLDGLVRSRTAWRFIANQTLFVPWGAVVPLREGNVYLNTDAWDGYRADRDAVAAALKVAGGGKGNLIVTGDMHAFSAAYVQTNYGAQSELLRDAVAVEFMIGGLTSAGLGSVVDLAAQGGAPATGTPPPPGNDTAVEQAILAANPHFRHFNWTRNGYSIAEFRKDACDVELFVVDKSQDTLDPAARILMRKYRVSAGTPTLDLLEANPTDGMPFVAPTIPPQPSKRGLTIKAAPAPPALPLLKRP